MRIEEISEILGLYPLLFKPKHILITHEPITDGSFAGLQPKWRSDVIVLGKDADKETLIHEILHTMGLGEFAAYPLAKILAIKHDIISQFPIAKVLLTRKVVYKKCPEELSEFLAGKPKYRGRIEHFVREEGRGD